METVTSHQQTQRRAAGELFKLGVFSLKVGIFTEVRARRASYATGDFGV